MGCGISKSVDCTSINTIIIILVSISIFRKITSRNTGSSWILSIKLISRTISNTCTIIFIRVVCVRAKINTSVSGRICVQWGIFWTLLHTSIWRTISIRSIITLTYTFLCLLISKGSVFTNSNARFCWILSESILFKRTGSYTFQGWIISKVAVRTCLQTFPCSIVCKS